MDYAALAKQHGGTPLVDYVTLARKFGGAALESKPVHHASDDVEALRASAERQAPKIGDAVASAAENVPGAEVEAVRDSKDSDRIEDKAERQGVQPSQVGDIAAAKVTVPDQPAAQQVLENLHQQMPVESAEGKVTGEPGNNSVRQTQAIVNTKASAGEPVKKAEVILQTPEMTKATDKTHDDYREAQELRSQGKEAEARQLETEISRTHEAAEHAAQERTNESTDTAKEKGSTHGASDDPSSSRSTEGPEAAREKEKARAPGSAPIPIAVRRVDDSKAAQAANPAPAQPASTESSNKADHPVGSAATPATDFDAIKARLPELQDKLSTSVRAPKPLNNAKKNPDIGIDFDGTLFTEESDGSIGKPIPERIASAKRFLDEGKTLEIISRRATRPEELPKMRAALKAVGLGDIPITDQKNADMLFDNSAHHAPTNANTPLSRSNNARKEKSDA